MSLRPPSTSPGASPGPTENGKAISRQSMGPSARASPGLPPASPRPGAGAGSARPTSELLGSGSAGMFQTPEAEALDQWFENLQNYEATLEDMAAASLDVNFKEELSAIEQWFKVLSEAERTAALYSLLQHSTQVQIRFFITVLQQMARSDPMTALLSPAMGGSMQSQMEAKLASMSLKSPSLKSGLPSSPTTRNFSPGNRSSLILDNSSNFLSPESAVNQSSHDPAATLVQQRAKLNASNPTHRISAPVLTAGTLDGRHAWASPSQLGQVSEQNAQEVVANPSRPKSTEFPNVSPKPGIVGGDATVPTTDSWASMVNTPLIPMFQKDTRVPTQNLDAAANKLSDWSNKNANATPGVPRMGDPTVHRRPRPPNDSNNRDTNNGSSNAVYDDNGNLLLPGANSLPQNQQGRRHVGGVGNNGFSGTGGWSGGRSPVLPNATSHKFHGLDDGNINNGLNGLGMQMGGMGMGGMGMGIGNPGLGMPGLAGMNPMSPINMNMLSAMGMGAMSLTPEAQLLAAQMAASGFGQGHMFGMQSPISAGLSAGRRTGKSPGLKSAGSSVGSRGDGAAPKAEDEVDPALLEDVPAWLRSLRLHKYTPNFKDSTWREMVMMDEEALEAKGVAALGARRKMLKTFEIVRRKMGIDGGLPSSVPIRSP